MFITRNEHDSVVRTNDKGCNRDFRHSRTLGTVSRAVTGEWFAVPYGKTIATTRHRTALQAAKAVAAYHKGI